MANALTASGLALPQINTMDQFGAGVSGAQTAQINQQNLDTAKQKQYMEGLNTIAAGAAYAIDPQSGQVDPAKWNEVVDSVAKSGADVGDFRDHPYLAPMLVKLSLSTQQQIANAQNQEQIDQALKNYELEVTKARTGPAPTDDQKELTQINTERKAAGKPELGMEDFLAGKKSDSNGITITNPDGTTTQIGGKGTNAYDTAEGKGLYETGQTIAKEGRSGTAQLGTLSEMEKLLADDKVYTGIGADQVQQLQRAGSLFGDASLVKDTETFNALAKKSVLDLAGGSLGTGFSNGDRDYLDAQVPSLQNTKPGNLQLISVMKKVAQRKVDIAKFTAQYKKDHGGKLDYQFDDALATWAEGHPLFSDKDKAAGSAAASPNGPVVDWTTYFGDSVPQ